MRYRNRWATLVALATLVSLPGCGVREPDAQQAAEVSAAAAADALDRLAALVVASEGSMTGYSRKRFRHWIGQDGECNTRELVLQRQGSGVERDSECRVTAGTWVSPYDGKHLDDDADLDIDHLVPLAEAWRSGARGWTDDQRERFANDLDSPQLVAVTAGENRAKGDRDPAEWRPPSRGYWCAYAIGWVVVKALYQLRVDQRERDALRELLATCPD